MGFTPDMDVAFQDASYKYDFQNSRYVFMRWKVGFSIINKFWFTFNINFMFRNCFWYPIIKWIASMAPRMKASIMCAQICRMSSSTAFIIITRRRCFRDSICDSIVKENFNRLNFVKQ